MARTAHAANGSLTRSSTKLQRAMRKMFGSVDDVAGAVFYAVIQPIDVNVFEIVVRPPRMLGL